MSDVRPLEIRGLCHDFGAQPVVRDVDLAVAPGEFVSLLGPSGSGKTTVLRAVAGLLTPTSGRISLRGRTAVDQGREQLLAEERGIGLVFQDYALFPHLSVTQNIAFGLPSADPERVDALVRSVGLEGMEQRRPAKLSGGQQQRVALARALAPRPSLLLLDEPFANVDAQLRGQMGTELRSLAAREGLAVLLVTHDRSDALALSDRVVILAPAEGGSQVVQDDTPEVVYLRPANTVAARLTGPVGVLAGEATDKTARTNLGELPLQQAHQGPVDLLIRPENARFEPDPDGLARVEWVRFAGRSTLLGVGSIHCEWTTGAPPEIGTKGRVTLAKPAWAVPAVPRVVREASGRAS